MLDFRWPPFSAAFAAGPSPLLAAPAKQVSASRADRCIGDGAARGGCCGHFGAFADDMTVAARGESHAGMMGSACRVKKLVEATTHAATAEEYIYGQFRFARAKLTITRVCLPTI